MNQRPDVLVGVAVDVGEVAETSVALVTTLTGVQVRVQIQIHHHLVLTVVMMKLKDFLKKLTISLVNMSIIHLKKKTMYPIPSRLQVLQVLDQKKQL